MLPYIALRVRITELTVSQALLYALTAMVIVMVVLAILSILILIISKLMARVEPKTKKDKALQPELPQAEPQAANAAVSLIDTDEETAAVLMAIVAEQSGIAPDHLHFKSICLLDENESLTERTLP